MSILTHPNRFPRKLSWRLRNYLGAFFYYCGEHSWSTARFQTLLQRNKLKTLKFIRVRHGDAQELSQFLVGRRADFFSLVLARAAFFFGFLTKL